MNERGIFQLIIVLLKGVECCYCLFGICFSIMFCVCSNVLGYKCCCQPDMFYTIIGFGIASLSFLTTHINGNQKGLPKAVSAVTLDIIVSLVGLFVSFLDQDICLFHYIEDFLVIFTIIWTAHCTLHIASICLPKYNKDL